MPCASPPIWLEPQHVAHRGDEDEGAEHAGQPATAAEHADAAQEGDRDHVELEAERVVGARIGEAGREHDPGQRRDQAGDDEEQEAQAADPDPGVERRVRVAAYGVDPPAGRRALEHGGEDRGEQEERHERPGDRRAGDRADAEVGEGVRELVDRAGAEDDVADAPEEGQVPSVTTSDGRSSPVTSSPLSAPARAPVASAAVIAAGSAKPAWTSTPSTTLASARMLATERSISRAMMSSTSGKARSAFSETPAAPATG